jgi:hypothetical protein
MSKPVVLLSPFRAPTILERTRNKLYAQEAMADALARGEAPFASHLLYPQVLDDGDGAEREQGIAAELAWIDLARCVVVYVDRGISAGMAGEILHCFRHGYAIKLRSLNPQIDAAQVDAMIEAQVLVRDLFSDIVLELPPLAGPHAGNGSSAAQEAQDAPQGVLPSPTPAQSLPPSLAPPAGPWGSGNG